VEQLKEQQARARDDLLQTMTTLKKRGWRDVFSSGAGGAAVGGSVGGSASWAAAGLGLGLLVELVIR